MRKLIKEADPEVVEEKEAIEPRFCVSVRDREFDQRVLEVHQGGTQDSIGQSPAYRTLLAFESVPAQLQNGLE